MYSNDWTVVADERPGGNVACFYCKAPVGSQHNEGCVIRSKTVVVEVKFTIVREVPEDWGVEMIEFQMNESSSCADNLLEEIGKLAKAKGCSCGFHESRYVRDATEEDVADLMPNTEVTTA